MSGGEPRAAAGRETDTQGLEVLDIATCRELLRDEYVGRIALAAECRPTIRPVNYVLDGHDIVMRTAPGSLLAAASRSQHAAFEIDGIDLLYHTGWSVVVEGELELVVDEEETRRLEHLPLRPWAKAVPRMHWVRLRCETMSGRQLF